LPHWRADSHAYFVTWRLFKGQEPLSEQERELVARSIEFFAGTRYNLEAYVVMDDHVHVVACPREQEELAEILHSWKSYTAHRLLKRGKRRGRIWQDEYFDRLIRGEVEMREKSEYILNNPQKRWPDLTAYKWVWVRGMDQNEEHPAHI
jgi:putative transposase